MKIFKKISVILLAIIAAFSFSMFVACNNGNSGGVNNLPPVTPPENQVITFDKNELNMVVGDEEYLLASAHSFTGITFGYESSDESIVTIDNLGKVTAQGQGVASVYAVYGNFKAECIVTVTHGNLLPAITIDNLTSELVVPKTVDYALNPYVTFNGKKFENATFSYETSNSNVSINQSTGVITGVNVGTAEVTVKASWDGVSGIPAMQKTFTVKVTSAVQMYINGGSTSSVVIYNKVLDKLNGVQTTMTADFNVTASDLNGALTPSIEVLEQKDVNGNDASIVSYADGTLTGTGVLGTAVVKVSVEVDDTTFDLYVDVLCDKAIGDYMTASGTEYNTVDFNTLIGDIDVAGIFGEDTTLVSANLGRDTVVVENNKLVSGIPGDAFSANPEPKVITLFDDQVGYNVEIIPYVYKDATDIDKTYNFSAHDGKIFDDNFVVRSAADIFGTGKTFKEVYAIVDGAQQQLPLSEEDGESILQVKTDKEKISYQFAIASDDDMIRVTVDAYTLILDEMMDFDYFIVKDGSWGYERSAKWTIYSGMEWNGSYVLANDIDASEYYSPNAKYPNSYHGLEGTRQYLGWDNVTYQTAHFGSRTVDEVEGNTTFMGLKGKGMSGIFDGRGHVIKNYVPESGGLFQVVNGGVVKNLGFTNLAAGQHGAVAAKLFNSSVIENCFFEVNPEKSFKGLYSGSIAFAAISKTSQMKNIVIINESTQLPNKESSGALFNTTSSFGDNNGTIILVSPQPLVFKPNASYDGGAKPYYEGQRLDGVDTKVDDYPSGLIKEVYHYTSFAKLAQDKDYILNKISGFNTEVFEMIDNYLPIFKTSLSADSFEVYVGDYKASEHGTFITKGEDVEVTIRYNGIRYAQVDSLTVNQGNTVVSTNSNIINGQTSGSAQITASFSFGGQTVDVPFKVNSVAELTAYEEKTYYVSTIDGVFFQADNNGKFTIVDDPLSEIFGNATDFSDLFVAYDSEGNALEIDVTNGMFNGIPTNKKGFLDTYIDLYTDAVGKRVEIRSAGLIIDEASDLAYFKITQEFGRLSGPWVWQFGEGDFVWDSYYVLADNIDASEYGVHDVENGMMGDWSNRASLYNTANNGANFDYTANNGIKYGGIYHNGLIGTLDGNGYIISNLTTTASGLFGVVGDATVKNIGFVNCKTVDNRGGVLAWVVGGATNLENVYVETVSEAIGPNYSTLMGTLGVNAKMNGVLIVDNTSFRTDTRTSEYTYGSLTSLVNRYSNDAGTMKNPLKYNGTFQNVILVSNKALQATVPANVNGSAVSLHVEGQDAEYIDGVLSTKTTLTPFEYYNKVPGVTMVETTPIAGIRRYTSLATLTADATANASVLSSFNSTYWTVENGEITFKQRENVYITLAEIDGKIVGESVSKPLGATVVPGLNVNGVSTPATSVTIIDGGELATVEGTTVKLGATTGSVTVEIAVNDATEIVVIKIEKPVITYDGNTITDNTIELMLAQTKSFAVTFGGTAIQDVVIDTAETTDLITIDGLSLTANVSTVGTLEIRVTINGVAFTYTLKVVSPDILADGTAITANATAIDMGQSINVTFAYDGVLIEGTPELTTTSTAITIDGATITANEITNQLETATVNAALNGMQFAFTVTVHNTATQIDVEPYFSAHDGEFFNADMSSTLTLAEILGETDVQLVAAKDADGNILSVKDGRIYGLETGKALKEIQLTVYTTTASYKLNVKAYTLIIDSLEDFNSYFKVTKHPTKDISNYNVPYNEDEGKWDGYYILATDLVGNGLGSSASKLHNLYYSYNDLVAADIESAAAAGVTNDLMTEGVYVKGLTGVFDGNGHEIYNLKMHLGGMFGVVLGGTVKNLKIRDSGFAYDSVIADVIAGGATVENVHVINTLTNRYNWYAFAREIGTATIKNVVVEAPNVTVKNYSYYNNTGSFAKVNSTATIENVILVTPLETHVSHNTSNYNVYQDAAIVDGVANETSGITLVNGVSRYTSYAKLEQNVENIDWTSWNSDVWEIVKGVPTFVSRLTESYALSVDGEAYDCSKTLEVEEGDQIDLSVLYDGKAIVGQPEVTLVEGDQYVSLDGTTLTANSDSSAGTITVKVAYRSNEWTFNVTVWNSITATDYGTELQFSAYNGLFYNGENIVTIDDIFGKDVTVVRAVDKDGNRLTVSEDGAILGLDLGAIDSWTENVITLYTAEEGLKVKVKAATLIIDSLDTFKSYFKLSSTPTVTATNATFADGDMEWNGYYVMVKDIEGNGTAFSSTLSHNLANFKSMSATDVEDLAATGASNGIMTDGVYTKGLTGTFDGNGHQVYNLKMYSGGLFGMILGGTVKNLKVNICGYNYDTAVATIIAGGAKIEDLQIITNKTSVYDYFPFARQIATATIKNVFVNSSSLGFNTTQNYASNAGSFAGVSASRTTIQNVIVLSSVATNNSVYKGNDPAVAPTQDAAILDGVANTTENITLISGLRRYTTLDAIKNDTTIDWASWNADVWEIVNGKPEFLVDLTGTYSVLIDGATQDLTQVIELTEEDTLNVTVALNGASVAGKPTLTIVSGQGYVSVNGNVITAVAESSGEVKVKAEYRTSTWEILLTVYPIYQVNDYATEYQFSAHDGLFFNGDTVVSLADILGEDAVVTRAYDKDGNRLTVSEGAILGLDLGKQTTWADNAITIYTEGGETATRILVKAADQIIDEAKDLNVFVFKGDAIVNKKIVIEEGFVWDGYYVVVKDIDALAEGYAHISAEEETDDPNDVSLATVAASNVGLSGVFDGQGHTISNLQINAFRNAGQTGSGLFTYINAGVVKNVNFKNICASTKLGTIDGVTTGVVANSGVLASLLVNKAVIENVYLTYYDIAGGSNARVLYYNADTGCEVRNSVITYQDNFNAQTSSSSVHNANGGGLYAYNSATFTNVYYISDLCLVVPTGKASTSNTVVKKGTDEAVIIGKNIVNWRKVTVDTAYVDDVYSTTCSYVIAATQGTQYQIADYDICTNGVVALTEAYEITTIVPGIKRYTSLSALGNNWTKFTEGNALRNDFSSWSTDVWTISTNGVPTMHVKTTNA